MKVVIMRGIPGAGKSSYIKNNLPDAFVCSADHFFMMNNEYQFVPEMLPRAHGRCLQKFTHELLNWAQYNLVVVDNTNICVVEIAPYAALAIAYGYELEIITLDVLLEVAVSRQTHNVPENIVKKMFHNLHDQAKFFPPWWKHTVLSH